MGNSDIADIWIFDTDRDTVSQLTSNADGDLNNSSPIWSPDGSRVVFGAARNGRFGLYVARADGVGDEELLVESEARILPMSWSPNGRFIVYWEPGFSGTSQWVLPLTGDRAPFQLLEGPSAHGQISPDGNWIAYRAGREIFVKAFPTGSDTWQVSTNGGSFARWRADGRELYFMSTGSWGQIMAADIRVTGSSIQPGTPRALFDSGYDNGAGGRSLGNWHTYAVSPDGQRFLIPRPEPDTLVVFDRQGEGSKTVDRDVFTRFPPALPAFSPDGTRVAVVKNTRVWVLDIATGEGMQITSLDEPQGRVRAVVWSPDGRHVAYLVQRRDSALLYRQASTGAGPAELLYRLPGFNYRLTEWSADGRFLLYYSPQLGGNVLFGLPLTGEREPVEMVRSEFDMLGARLSPDGRFLAYRSDESGSNEIWVRPFDDTVGPGAGAWQVSTEGGLGMVSWREDGRELYYLAPDRGVMAMDVETASTVEFGEPRLLFTAPEAIPTAREPVGSISRDGQQVMFAVPPASPPPPLQQITMFDRHGGVVQTLGEPGDYFGAALSPDGTRVAAVRFDIETGQSDIWSFDSATGEGTQVTDDLARDNTPIWSPDGSQILYVSRRRGAHRGIYRRAWDGSGSEELLFQYAQGAGMNLSDVSQDGQFVTFTSGGVVLVVPLTGTDPFARQAIEFAREEFQTRGGRFSPDGRFMAYVSAESGEPEVYVRPFDASSDPTTAEGQWQVSHDGAAGMISWRGDGQEMYFVNAGQQVVMAVDVTTTPVFRVGTPRPLFRLTRTVAGGGSKNISRDGQRFVFVMPVAPGTPAP